MDTAHAARARIIWTSIALVLISIASCFTYVYLAKVPECPRIKITNANSINITFSQNSGKHWLLKAYNHTANRLLWEDEVQDQNSRGEKILTPNDMWIVIQEKGVYLIYIHINFILKPQNNNKSSEDLILQLECAYSDNETEFFSASRDTRMLTNTRQDAQLSTFFKMHLLPNDRFSVIVFPSNAVNTSPRPFSTFITIIKLADGW